MLYLTHPDSCFLTDSLALIALSPEGKINRHQITSTLVRVYSAIGVVVLPSPMHNNQLSPTTLGRL